MPVAPAESARAGPTSCARPELLRVRNVLGEAAVVGFVALLVSVVITWPLVLSLDDHAHDPYDPLFQAWSIDWVQHALSSGDTIADGNIFAPSARTHAYSDPLVSLAIVLLPLRWVGMSPVGLVNVTLLGAYATSAAAGYVFARITTRRRLIGACCAAVFAFGPYNAQLAQHAYLAAHAGPAVAAAAAWRLADRRARGERTWPSQLVLAVTVALNATTSFYLAVFTVTAAIVVLAVRWRSVFWRGAATAVAAVAAGAVAALPVAWPYLQNAREVDGFEWELSGLGFNAAHFGMVDPTLTLWGGLLGSPRALFTQATFPGLTVIALTLLGVWRWITLRRKRVDPTLTSALGTAVALVLTRGSPRARCRCLRVAPVHAVSVAVRARAGVFRAPRLGSFLAHRTPGLRRPCRRRGAVAGPPTPCRHAVMAPSCPAGPRRCRDRRARGRRGLPALGRPGRGDAGHR